MQCGTGRLTKQISFFENLSNTSSPKSDGSSGGIINTEHDRLTKVASSNPLKPSLQIRSASLVSGGEEMGAASIQKPLIPSKSQRVLGKSSIAQTRSSIGQEARESGKSGSAEKTAHESSTPEQQSKQSDRTVAVEKIISLKSTENRILNDSIQTKPENVTINSKVVLEQDLVSKDIMPMREVSENETLQENTSLEVSKDIKTGLGVSPDTRSIVQEGSGELSCSVWSTHGDGFIPGSGRNTPRLHPDLLTEYERRKRQLGVRIDESVTSSSSRQNSLENDLRDVDDLSLSSPSTADSGIQQDIHTIKQTVRWADERTDSQMTNRRKIEPNITVELETGDETRNRELFMNRGQIRRKVTDESITSPFNSPTQANNDIFIMHSQEHNVADSVIIGRSDVEAAVGPAVASSRSANTAAAVVAATTSANVAAPAATGPSAASSRSVETIAAFSTINSSTVAVEAAASPAVISSRSVNIPAAVAAANSSASVAAGDSVIKSVDKLEPTSELQPEISSDRSMQQPCLQADTAVRGTRPEAGTAVRGARPEADGQGTNHLGDRENVFENSSENQNYCTARDPTLNEISETVEQATGASSAGSGNRNNSKARVDESKRNMDESLDGVGLSCVEAECTLLSAGANQPNYTTYNIYRVIKKKKKKLSATDENCNMSSLQEQGARMPLTSGQESDNVGHILDTPPTPVPSASDPHRIEGSTGNPRELGLSEEAHAFRARFLGSLPISASALTSMDHGASCITRCINQFNEINNNNSRTQHQQYSDPGSERVLLEFVGHVLHIIRMVDDVTLDSLSVGSIRVWGAGKDPESKDFAFVARDLITDVHMCHVFRCERPAHHVSNTLRNICLHLATNRNKSNRSDITANRSYVTNPSRIRHSRRSERGSSARVGRVDKDLTAAPGTGVYQRRSESKDRDITRANSTRLSRTRSGSGARARSGSRQREDIEIMTQATCLRRSSQRSNGSRSGRDEDNGVNSNDVENVRPIRSRQESTRSSERNEADDDSSDDDTASSRPDESAISPRSSMSQPGRHVGFKENRPEFSTSSEKRGDAVDCDTDDGRQDHNRSSTISNLTEIFQCLYLGRVQVNKATGMNVLNDAMQFLHSRVPATNWIPVDVTIEAAAATISISEHRNSNELMYKGHLRTLTFLGISINNAKLGSFIVHTLRNEFIAHVFYFENTAGPWCRALQNICAFHYQQCMENRRRFRTSSRVSRADQGEQQQQQQQPLMHQRSFVHRLFYNGPQMIRPRAYKRCTSSAM